jgi:hypothetical protein
MILPLEGFAPVTLQTLDIALPFLKSPEDAWP